MYCKRKEAPLSAAQHTAAGTAVEDDTRHRSHRCCTPPAADAGGRRALLLHSWDTAAGAAGSAGGPTDPSKVAHAHTDHTADEDDGGGYKEQEAAAVRSRPGVRAAAAPRLDTQGTGLAAAATKFV